MPAVSVIMPVYNQEKYLYKSLSSIKNQTFKDFELLIINDGSTDNSESIINDFCKNNNNFRYIKKTNGGVASARQKGLNEAIGEYIIHVDPDDWVEPDFLEKLYNEAKKNDADLVFCNYIEEFVDTQNRVDISILNIKDIQSLKLNLADGHIWGVCWNKLIKAKCIKNKISFEPNINFQEDKLFFYKILAYNNNIKFGFIFDYLYHYNRANESSSINSQSTNTLIQAWKVKSLIFNSEEDNNFKNQLANNLISELSVITLLRNKDLKKNEKSELLRPFKKFILKKNFKSLLSPNRKNSVKNRLHSFEIILKMILF